MIIISCSKNEVSINEDIPIDIYHYDWDPDTVVFLGSIDSIIIDLNNDNIDDLIFRNQTAYGSAPGGGETYTLYSTSEVESVNEALKISMGTHNTPTGSNYLDWNCLSFNDPILNELTWENSFYLIGYVHGSGDIGVWNHNDHEGYIGLKFETNQSTYFGWIKINKDSGTAFCEYAISETNNATILAGQSE